MCFWPDHERGTSWMNKRGGADDRFGSSALNWTLDQGHCSGAATSPAFTGLLSTYAMELRSSAAERIQ